MPYLIILNLEEFGFTTSDSTDSTLNTTSTDATTTQQTTNSINNGWSVSLSNLVIMSANTTTLIKRSVAFEMGEIFQLVKNKVKKLYID